MNRWARRAGVASVVLGLALLYATISGRAVDRPAVAAAVAAAFAVGWLCVDTSYLPSAPHWQLYRATSAWRTHDPRFGRLAQELAESADRRDAAAAVHSHLVRVADRLLLDEYAVSRAVDPDAARRLLGEPLTTYLDSGPGRDDGVGAPLVSAALDRLESL